MVSEELVYSKKNRPKKGRFFKEIISFKFKTLMSAQLFALPFAISYF